MTSWRASSGLPGGARIAAPDASRSTTALGAWGRSVLSDDAATWYHCARVGVYAVEVARQLDFPHDDVEAVRIGALLHDIGKARLPAEILHRVGRLSAAEFQLVKLHPQWGLEMLEAVDCPAAIRPMVRSHHEKWDGTGYPDGLVGDDVPLTAAIICIADVYDALTTRRCYRPAMSARGALAEMRQRRRWWHPEVYAAFARAIGRRLEPHAVPRPVAQPYAPAWAYACA
jgi:putative nucleotidyltransferase with HDIG domain